METDLSEDSLQAQGESRSTAQSRVAFVASPPGVAAAVKATEMPRADEC